METFELRLNDDPVIFDILSDQTNKILTFYSYNSSSSPGSDNDRTQSKFKVALRWRYAEEPIKSAEIVKKIQIIIDMVTKEENIFKDMRHKYDSLMQFNNYDALKLLDVWGVPKLHHKPRFILKGITASTGKGVKNAKEEIKLEDGDSARSYVRSKQSSLAQLLGSPDNRSSLKNVLSCEYLHKPVLHRTSEVIKKSSRNKPPANKNSHQL